MRSKIAFASTVAILLPSLGAAAPRPGNGGAAAASLPERGALAISRLQDLAGTLIADPETRYETASEGNLAGLRSESVLFSRRLDSLTYFMEDKRYPLTDSYAGTDAALVERARSVLGALAVPAAEIQEAAVLREKTQAAWFNPVTNRLEPGEVKEGRRLVAVTRHIQGLPVFSSRALVGLTREGRLGLLELHWPAIASAAVTEAQGLKLLVQRGWTPPEQARARVESVEAGFVHSPAVGMVMDVRPVIRVIYVPENKSIGRKPVLYLDRKGNPVSMPRTFERVDEEPAGPRF